jgi:hypothetical protein
MVSSPLNCPDAGQDDLKGDSEMNRHDLITAPLAKFRSQVPPRGRPIKFTPERIQQIRNLVERGKSREEIAELIEVTVGSLQVTCSRLGTSLRRPKVDNGVHLLRQHSPIDRNGSMPPHPIEEQSQGNSRSGPAEPALAAKQQEQVQTLEAGFANIAIRIQRNDMERTIELPLTMDEVARLAWEAKFRDMGIGQFIGELIAAMVTKDLFRVVLDKP